MAESAPGFQQVGDYSRLGPAQQGFIAIPSLGKGAATPQKAWENSAFQHALQEIDILGKRDVAGSQFLDLFDGMHHRRVVAPAKRPADIG